MFADESGDFGCRRAPGVSRYFILTTVTLADCTVGDSLLALRRRLAWEGHGLNSDLHATTETQAVRDEVFALLRGADIRVDATLLDKPKLDPKYYGDDSRVYGLVWSLHMRRLASALLAPGDELLVVSAAIGTKQTRKRFYEAVTAEVARAAPTVEARTAHWSASSDPCLQVAVLLRVGHPAPLGAHLGRSTGCAIARTDRRQDPERDRRVRPERGHPLLTGV